MKAEDLATAIVLESIPRWGQELANAQKWAFIVEILYAPEEGTDDDDDFEPPDPSVLLKPIDFASAYAEDEDEALEAHILLADLQNDVFWGLKANGVGDAVEVDLQYHQTMVWWRKLKDKANALDEGLEKWTHDWIN